MKKFLLGLVAAAVTMSAAAGSYTYSWASNVLPPPPHNGTRVAAAGYFIVPDTAVATGSINPSDVAYLFVHTSSPANYTYRVFDGGALQVDPVTGAILSGGLHSTCPFSTYGRGANFTSAAIFCDNPAGGSWAGHWVVTYNP